MINCQVSDTVNNCLSSERDLPSHRSSHRRIRHSQAESYVNASSWGTENKVFPSRVEGTWDLLLPNAMCRRWQDVTSVIVSRYKSFQMACRLALWFARRPVGREGAPPPPQRPGSLYGDPTQAGSRGGGSEHSPAEGTATQRSYYLTKGPWLKPLNLW